MLEPSPDPRDITGADQRELAQAVRELMLCAGLTTVTRPEMTRARALVDEASRVLAQHSTQRVDRLSYEEPSRSEEHTSELQSLMRISYAVFCLKKKNTQNNLE